MTARSLVSGAGAGTTTSAIEVVAAFEPLARLEAREATLGGAVPLRVAQACVPLLEGNALGLQIVFARRLTVRSRLGRISLAEGPARDAVDRAHRAAVPFLAARGLLREAWRERLARSWWWSERGVLRVWTGLLVQPAGGTWLCVTGAGSRASLAYHVQDTWIGDLGAPVPLVVALRLAGAGEARLEGEVATVLAARPSVRAEIVTLADAPGLARAHAAFYDARYFATKKGEVTRKYRRTVARERRDEEQDVADEATVRVAHFGGPPPIVLGAPHVLGPDATAPVPPPRGARLDVVRFTNAVPFRAHFDGSTLAIEPEREALARGAREVEAALGGAFVAAHQGAALYLTKYFTPHPQGEPHFFVKPWAFTETPAGWSSAILGARGEGWDAMRGVVWTDRFHATPAVFQLSPMRAITVPAGAPLIDVIALPRALAGALDVRTTRLAS